MSSQNVVTDLIDRALPPIRADMRRFGAGLDAMTAANERPSASAMSALRLARDRGVVALERCGRGRSATTLFVDLVVAVSRTLPLDRVKAIKERDRARPSARKCRGPRSVEAEPRALDDETVLERVMVIARNRALAVHHVTVHDIGGRLSVSLDLEVDGKLSLARPTTSRTSSRRRSRRARARRRGRDPYRTAAAAGSRRPRRPDRAGAAVEIGARERSRPKHGMCATCTTCGCARPTKARSSTSIATSIPRYPCRRCTRRSTRWSARCAAVPVDQAGDRPRRAAALS